MPADTENPTDAPTSIHSATGAQTAAGGIEENADADSDFAAERREQLLTAPKADDVDAAPRIEVTDVAPDTKRIDVRDDAPYRPGG